MRRRTLVAALAAAVVALGGCGMPSQTRVQDDGAGLAAAASGASETGIPPPGRTASNDPRQFVLNFLQAAAGDSGTAVRRQRDFMPKGTQWNPPSEIHVIDLADGEPVVDADKITVRLRNFRHVGAIGPDGVFDVAPDPIEDTYQFRVSGGENQNNGVFLQNAPEEMPMLMSLDALERYYEPRPLYFWDTEHSGLVPDVRYLPKSVPLAQRPDTVLEWLINGPSPWLVGAVEGLPADTDKRGRVPAPADGRLVVNLNAAARSGDEQQIDRLGSQLRWSFRPDWQGQLELRIDNQVEEVFADDGYLSANPAQNHEPEQRFCVFRGEVRPLSGAADTLAEPPLGNTANHDVISAAFTRSGTTTGDQVLGALVRRTSDGAAELLIGEGDVYRKVGDAAYDRMSRPTWLAGPAAAGLVAADGHLYQFRRDDANLRRVTLPGSSGPVTAVAAPPDGRRVAYVAGGRLYVAALSRTGGQPVKVERARRLPVPLARVTAVAWSGQDRLVIAGQVSQGARSSLWEVSVDGTPTRLPVTTLPEGRVEHLVAYPEKPTTSFEERRVMYQTTGGLSYELFSDAEQIEANMVLGAKQGPAAEPTAPFFLE